jgi:hypothetical protein
VDGHHLGVHREGSVCLRAATCTDLLHGSLFLLLVLRLALVALTLLQLGLHLSQGIAIEGAACDTAMLECAAIKSRTVVVMALADDFAAAHNDTSMAVVQRRFSSLLEAERQVTVRLHFGVSGGGDWCCW